MGLVSIIVLSYNNLERLTQTIDSIYRQDYENMEVILSDDGSEEYDSLLIESCEKMLKKKNIVSHSFHNKENMGTVRNFNNAIRASNGEYIIPLSCGDKFRKSTSVSHIVRRFVQTGSLILTARRRCLQEDGMVEIRPTDKQVKLIQKGGKTLLQALCWDNFISGSCTYYSREIFDVVGMFDERMRLLEDAPFYIRCLLGKINIDFLDEVVIDYDVNGVSSGTVPNPKLEKDKRIMRQSLIYPNCDKTGRYLCKGLAARAYKLNCGGRKKNLLSYYLRHADVFFYKLWMHVNYS